MRVAAYELLDSSTTLAPHQAQPTVCGLATDPDHARFLPASGGK